MEERNGGRGGPVIRFIGRIAPSKLSITMATITERKRKDRSVSYRAEIKLRKNGEILHQLSKTFNKKMLAAK